MSLFEFMDYAKTAGGLAAPIFAVLFWLERDERKDAQRELNDVAKQSVTAMIELKNTINQLSTIFSLREGR
jgi:hypothetical protein